MREGSSKGAVGKKKRWTIRGGRDLKKKRGETRNWKKLKS